MPVKLTYSTVQTKNQKETLLIVMAEYDPATGAASTESVIIQQREFYYTNGGAKIFSNRVHTVDITDMLAERELVCREVHTIAWGNVYDATVNQPELI